MLVSLRYQHNRDFVAFLNLFADTSKDLPRGWDIKHDRANKVSVVENRLCLLFEIRVIPRISSYPWNKKQQCFSNIKSRVILGITHPKLFCHYRWDKLGINSGQEKMLQTSTTILVDYIIDLLLQMTGLARYISVTKPLARLLEPLRIATILNIYLSNGM